MASFPRSEDLLDPASSRTEMIRSDDHRVEGVASNRHQRPEPVVDAVQR